MAGFTIKIKDNSFATIAEMKSAMAKGLEGAGLHLVGEAQEELENDPRRVDTGTLKRSIDKKVDANALKLTVGTPVDYAIWVHNGTRRMAPNEFLAKAFDRNMDQVKTYLENAGKG